MGKFLTLILLFCLSACLSESRKKSPLDAFPQSVELITPSQETIKTRVSLTWDNQQQGLSGVMPDEFKDDQGLLFFNLDDEERNFWMPDTYFDLDLFYLDKDLKILDIVRKLPHYHGRANPELIPRARPVWSRHVLEMKAGSNMATNLKIDDKLQWKSPTSLQQAEEIGKHIER